MGYLGYQNSMQNLQHKQLVLILSHTFMQLVHSVEVLYSLLPDIAH